ncbi:Peptidyl-prolyl cis-trans isomerase CWC27 like protein [Eufriesea mexicana]|uniref:Spliceosome-associated protein CWC27 homolog n=1 Tax=Eufriesea mexicana TaxID=516756 RepID=A0A310S4Q0_9HYME|nr:Peptidyl-prolyl cis-trans isomerase CWC27 like protein [Eufriesea mexicana]
MEYHQRRANRCRRIIFYSEKKLKQQYKYNDEAEVYKEKRVVPMKAVRREDAHYVELRNIKGAAYVSERRMCGIDKFHTRLRFCRRDLITMANAGKDDNGSQSFFSFSSTPTLQNKHTIFDKVTAETIYNMLKLEEALVDENDRSLCPPRLIKTIILNNPFSNIIPRIIVQESEEVKDNSKTETAAVKDSNLLSFGEEAEEDEEESVILNKKFSAVEPPGPPNKKTKKDCNSDWESENEVKT